MHTEDLGLMACGLQNEDAHLDITEMIARAAFPSIVQLVLQRRLSNLARTDWGHQAKIRYPPPSHLLLQLDGSMASPASIRRVELGLRSILAMSDSFHLDELFIDTPKVSPLTPLLLK